MEKTLRRTFFTRVHPSKAVSMTKPLNYLALKAKDQKQTIAFWTRLAQPQSPLPWLKILGSSANFHEMCQEINRIRHKRVGSQGHGAIFLQQLKNATNPSFQIISCTNSKPLALLLAFHLPLYAINPNRQLTVRSINKQMIFIVPVTK